MRVAGVLGRCALRQTSTKQDVEPPILRHKAAYQTTQSRIYQALDQHVLRHRAAYIKQESGYPQPCGFAVCLALLDWWPSVAGHSFCCIVRVAGVIGRCALTSTSTKQDVEQPILSKKAAYQTPKSRIYQALEQHVLRRRAAYIKQESSLSNATEQDISSLGPACIKTRSRLFNETKAAI